MKYSIHPSCRGKPEKRNNKMWVGDKQINLGFDWTNVESSWDDFFELVTVDGHAVSQHLKGSPRCNKNFDEAWFVFVDIDNGMTIEDLFENDFYNEYGAGFYNTPSHTLDHHRFRIMHRLQNPISNVDRMTKLYIGLMTIYGYGDAVCKDAARLFYGTIESHFKENRGEVFLPDEIVDAIVQGIEERQAEEEAKFEQEHVDYTPILNENRKVIIDLLQQSYVGEWEVWRSIAWAMKAAGFSSADFQYVTTGMMNKKTPTQAQKMWDDGKPEMNTFNMGTIINFLNNRYGTNWRITHNPYYKNKYGENRLRKNIVV